MAITLPNIDHALNVCYDMHYRIFRDDRCVVVGVIQEPDQELETEELRVLKITTDLKTNIRERKCLRYLQNNLKDPTRYITHAKCTKLGSLLFTETINMQPLTLQQLGNDKYIMQLLSQLENLHAIEIIHNDIKISNIMYDREKDEVCFIDFGNADMSHRTLSEFQSQSEHRRPPESFYPNQSISNFLIYQRRIRKGFDKDLIREFEESTNAMRGITTIKSDVFALGCTILDDFIVTPQQAEFFQGMIAMDMNKRVNSTCLSLRYKAHMAYINNMSLSQ